MSLASEYGYASYGSFGRGGLEPSMWLLLQEACGHPNALIAEQGYFNDGWTSFPCLAAKKPRSSGNLLYSNPLYGYRSAVCATVLPSQTISTAETFEDESRSVTSVTGDTVRSSECSFTSVKKTQLSLVHYGDTETQFDSPLITYFDLPKKCQLHKSERDAPETSLTVTVADSGSPFMPETKKRAREYSKQRLARITEGVRALQEIVAPAKKLHREAVLDAAIDYAEKLRLQIGVLSHEMGGNGRKSDVITCTEGFGYYLVNDLITREPLEDTLAEMIEADMKSACSYLNGRGLALVPMAAIAHLEDS